MRKYIFLFLVVFILSTLNLFGQNNPVSWSYQVKKESSTEYLILLKAKIDSPWKMYDLGPYVDGPNPTAFKWTKQAGIELLGSTQMLTKPTRSMDPIFDMTIGYFKSSATFTQKVKLNSADAKLKVNVEWMVCDEKSCMPPHDEDLEIVIGNSLSSQLNHSSKIENTNVNTHLEVAKNINPIVLNNQEVIKQNELGSSVPVRSLWHFILEAILWGFAALLTPCVFPMVPMTVSYFLKSNTSAAKGRFNAGLYGFFIVALYTLPVAGIILITRWLGGDSVTADIFNFLATHWIPNVLFFLVFMVFAASFFGAFEITMPSKLVNSTDQQSEKGGILGIFFMSLTLVLVSFSCTGPIVGSVLIKSTSGEFFAPIVTMFAFSAAFAIPFTVFAFFPSILKNLPKSGGWLNSVKIVLGFIEVALGLKFLSVADQTYHWGILDREIYLAIWIVVFSLLGLYLLGKIKFAHDSEMKYLSVPRLGLALIVFSFVVYMIPGMWGAPLKALSGYLPPLSSQDFNINSGSQFPKSETSFKAKYSDFLHLPHGLEGFFDYSEALAYAKNVHKPLFVDFTGHGCVNCREMEARVWSDPSVLKMLREDFVIVALYADDKKELPSSEWQTTDKGKVLKTLGKINSNLALTKFGVNAQPYYAILDLSEQHLVSPRGYDLNVDHFIKFLSEAKIAFAKQ